MSPVNFAFPASDISNVNAVIVAPPSWPLNTISLLFASDLIIKSDESLLNQSGIFYWDGETNKFPEESSVGQIFINDNQDND